MRGRERVRGSGSAWTGERQDAQGDGAAEIRMERKVRREEDKVLNAKRFTEANEGESGQEEMGRGHASEQQDKLGPSGGESPRAQKVGVPAAAEARVCGHVQKDGNTENTAGTETSRAERNQA